MYRGHYHSSEYHNGNLYVIRRIGDYTHPGKDWTDELWVYDPEKQGKKLFSTKGIDFRVSPDEKQIAIIEGNENLIFFNLESNQIDQKIELANLADLKKGEYISPQGWSGDNEYFWGDIATTAYPSTLFRIKINDWRLDRFKVDHLPLVSGEFKLNPGTGQIAYSNYPPIFDADSLKKFEASKEKVTLLTYDLFIQKHEAITTSIAKAFKPKWVNHYTIEYENPKGQGRVTKKLAEPLVKLVVGPTGIPADTHILLVKKDGSLLYRKGNRKSLYSLEGEFDTIDISKEIKLNAWQIRGLHYLFDNNKFSEIKKDQEGYVTDAWVAKITFADKIGSHSVTFFPWGEKEGSSLAKIFEYLLKLSPEKISLYGFS